ncbi:MAG: histidine kinase [Solirubrobacteraceae bacterium]
MEQVTAARHRVQLARARWPSVRHADLILPCVVAVVQVAAGYADSRHNHPAQGLGAADLALLLAGPVALLGRRRHPVAVMWITFLATLGPEADRVAYISVIVSFFVAATGGHRRAAWTMLAAAYVGSLWLAPLARGDRTASLADALLLGGWLAVQAIAAETVRIRRERGVAANAARAATDRERVSAQRLVVARDLHDVVGHNISLINLQAGVGLDLIDAQPEQAREALATIRAVSREALDELRAMLAALRDADLDEAPPRSPSPDLEQLPELVEFARAAGLSVTAETTGSPRRPGAAVELAAYRIVQESLTNIARHAPGARASIVLSYRRDGLDLRIRDSGPAAGLAPISPAPGLEQPLDRPGSGIAGMRERAVALGGCLDAHHRVAGGFEVSAHLPIGGSP